MRILKGLLVSCGFVNFTLFFCLWHEGNSICFINIAIAMISTILSAWIK